ncbi:exosome complex component RRP45A-like isoform X2 [Aristolochia californica]|uniref:exosome complex component RRP45A-like isoform X2 n=1 Tax=Aristolochia californica TaxID=171875 RepID=UPI0035D6FD45
MDQKLANSWHMTINEKKFIEHALLSDLRVDGRRPFDYRRLTINFGREDGSLEVQLGQTRVMGFVTSQLVQPYRDRPNEGTLSMFTEFSPMADPSFEPGRPGEFAVELGRIIDRGLRESRAVDTESLCVLPGKLVWAIRVDLHILDNGGNLVDAANVAALAALSTFRRPECTLGGEDGQEIVVHPPEVKDPLPLIIHHLPIAVTFAFFDNGNILVVDPTYKEEAIMGGKMTVTMNSNGDVCAIQKAGGEGVLQSVIMQCLRISAVKAADITTKIKNAVEAYNTGRALSKVKRHSTLVGVDVVGPDIKMRAINDFSTKKEIEEGCSNDMQFETDMSQQGNIKKTKAFIGGPYSWDPYSKGVALDSFRKSTNLSGYCVANIGLEHA